MPWDWLARSQVLSLKTLGKQVEWWAQANVQRDLKTGNHTICAVEVPRQRPQRPTAKKFSTDGKASFHPNGESAALQSSKPRPKSFYMRMPIKSKTSAAALAAQPFVRVKVMKLRKARGRMQVTGVNLLHPPSCREASCCGCQATSRLGCSNYSC